MTGNSFGKAFKINCFGESHGKAIGVVIDGCPALLEIDMQLIRNELNRRRPGQSAITTQRNEPDDFEIISGVFEGKSTGSPIAIIIPNKDHMSDDYDQIKDSFRPSHADFTYTQKYGIRDYRGGGRSSARITAAWVAAGAVARMILNNYNIKINACVSAVGHIRINESAENIDFSNVESNNVRCPDPKVASEMEDYILKIREQGDSTGGIITCRIDNCPVGFGEPVFDKLHADLGKAMLTINAVKGFEYGSGFNASQMKGSEHNDIYEKYDDTIISKTNYSGGIQGGISNGMPIYFNVAFKPVSTIMKDQNSIDKDGNPVVLKAKGRHDPCVVPRAVPIVEAMSALVVCDHLLRNLTNKL